MKIDWESMVAVAVITLALIGAVSIVRDKPRATIIVVPVVHHQAEPAFEPDPPRRI